jgi:hypothetical protein
LYLQQKKGADFAAPWFDHEYSGQAAQQPMSPRGVWPRFAD